MKMLWTWRQVGSKTLHRVGSRHGASAEDFPQLDMGPKALWEHVLWEMAHDSILHPEKYVCLSFRNLLPICAPKVPQNSLGNCL